MPGSRLLKYGQALAYNDHNDLHWEHSARCKKANIAKQRKAVLLCSAPRIEGTLTEQLECDCLLLVTVQNNPHNLFIISPVVEINPELPALIASHVPRF